MDTVALNLPVNSFASVAAAGDDGTMVESAGGVDAIDFASLLAAGLDAAQANAAAAVTPQPAATAVDAPEVAPAEPLPEALAALAQNAPQVALPTAPTQGPDAAAHGTAARDLVGHAAKNAPHATAVAAQAAMIAAAPAAHEQAAAATSDELMHLTNPGANALTETLAERQATALAETASEPHATTPHQPLAEAAAAIHTLAAPDRPAAPQATALLEVGAPVSEPGFADALSRQVVWMVDKDAQVAELRINPPELGPVEVRLTLAGEEASAHFVSAHAEVRNAIEAALARLRETMAQAGIQLGETTVSAESFRDQSAAQEGQREARHGYRADLDASSSAHAPQAARMSVARGLIDVFA